MRYAVVFLLLIFTILSADAVLWDYQLSESPPGWDFSDGWTFSPPGANIYKECWDGMGFFEAILTNFEEVPEGTDSLVLEVSHSFIGTTYNGSVDGSIDYRTPTSTWTTIWTISDDTTHIGIIPLPSIVVQPGDLLKLRFYAEGLTGGSSSACTLDWTIHDIALTAVGDIQELQQTTWSMIKSSF